MLTLDFPASYARTKCRLDHGLSIVVSAIKGFVVTERRSNIGPNTINPYMALIGGAKNAAWNSNMASKMKANIHKKHNKIRVTG